MHGNNFSAPNAVKTSRDIALKHNLMKETDGVKLNKGEETQRRYRKK